MFPGVTAGTKSHGDQRGDLFIYLLGIDVIAATCGKEGGRKGGKEGHSTMWREALGFMPDSQPTPQGIVKLGWLHRAAEAGVAGRAFTAPHKSLTGCGLSWEGGLSLAEATLQRRAVCWQHPMNWGSSLKGDRCRAPQCSRHHNSDSSSSWGVL